MSFHAHPSRTPHQRGCEWIAPYPSAASASGAATVRPKPISVRRAARPLPPRAPRGRRSARSSRQRLRRASPPERRTPPGLPTWCAAAAALAKHRPPTPGPLRRTPDPPRTRHRPGALYGGEQQAPGDLDGHAMADAVRPPVQPVFTSQHVVVFCLRRSSSMLAYTVARRGMNGAPKHAEKVGVGSVTPSSVPATFAVNPDRKWYAAISGVRRARGGRTPYESQARKNTLRGVPAIPERIAPGMCSRVRSASVLGDRVVVPLDSPRERVDHRVLEHRAEADRLEDLRLCLRREANHLGIAAALEVEHTVRAPAVLVVAQETAGWIGRERGLARAGKPEEEGDIAALADVGRAVHRKYALAGQ